MISVNLMGDVRSTNISLRRFNTLKGPTLTTRSRRRHSCLVKEMKTLRMPVNRAAGMCTELPGLVEQLMVTPAGSVWDLAVWEACGVSAPT